MKCCLCQEEIKIQPSGWVEGHNAQPLAEGRACGTCNALKVIPKRLESLPIRKQP